MRYKQKTLQENNLTTHLNTTIKKKEHPAKACYVPQPHTNASIENKDKKANPNQ